MHADLERLLAKDLLPDITAVPLSDLRDLRVDCSGAEGDVSFVRRVAQGRLDIVGHEARRRAGAVDGEPELSDLLFDMPDLMADGGSGGAPSGRSVAIQAPGAVAQALIDQLDATVTANQLGSLGQLDDGNLTTLVDRLRDFEVELSTVRRRLHERIDSIQGEIARRYRDGEASIDSLLN